MMTVMMVLSQMYIFYFCVLLFEAEYKVGFYLTLSHPSIHNWYIPALITHCLITHLTILVLSFITKLQIPPTVTGGD